MNISTKFKVKSKNYKTSIPSAVLFENAEEIRKICNLEILDLEWFRSDINSFLQPDPEQKNKLVFKGSQITAKEIIVKSYLKEEIKKDYPFLTDFAIAQGICAAALEL